MIVGNGHPSVPPGFRFHPTDEELLYYYLKKKVSYEAIDLDVIREVDLNKLEPWDLKEKCRIGSGPQNEWYFFSHKDKKYPTGTRTNRATAAGFWKATGRDKAIYMGNAKRIGMRKTLVFYTGRAPHGQKTDWIMHEYRLDDEDPQFQQEDGWVVCRVFKKKNHGRGLQPELHHDDDYDNILSNFSSTHHTMKHGGSSSLAVPQPPQRHQTYTQPFIFSNNFAHHFDGTMHLPHLSSSDNSATTPGTSNGIFNTTDHLLRLTSGGCAMGGMFNVQQMMAGAGDQRILSGGEWGFLDKLLSSYQSLEQQHQHQQDPSQNKVLVVDHHEVVGTSSNSNATLDNQNNKFPFQYLGSESDWVKFSK